MQRAERATQARRELDRKFSSASLGPIAARPRSGWIRAIRGALGMSQAVLAERLGVSSAAVNKLEHAELHGGITIAKLAEVAEALDCTLIYALVPKSTLEETVTTRARAVAAGLSGTPPEPWPSRRRISATTGRGRPWIATRSNSSSAATSGAWRQTDHEKASDRPATRWRTAVEVQYAEHSAGTISGRHRTPSRTRTLKVSSRTSSLLAPT